MKQLITNGISLNDTIQSVNALLKIKNRNDMFTTVDMIEINLVNGVTTFMKYGACPTYILRDHEIIEVESKTLPMGIVSPLETIPLPFKCKDNGAVLLMINLEPVWQRIPIFPKLLIENLSLFFIMMFPLLMTPIVFTMILTTATSAFSKISECPVDRPKSRIGGWSP